MDDRQMANGVARALLTFAREEWEGDPCHAAYEPAGSGPWFTVRVGEGAGRLFRVTVAPIDETEDEA